MLSLNRLDAMDMRYDHIVVLEVNLIRMISNLNCGFFIQNHPRKKKVDVIEPS